MNQIPYVNITIYDISADLVQKFSEKVVKPFYLGGINVAIRNLMQKVVEEQKQKEKKE